MRLHGEEVPFIRYDRVTGEILNHGVMHREPLARERAAGGAVRIVPSDVRRVSHRVHPANGKVEPTGEDPARFQEPGLLLVRLASDLARSDQFFLSDMEVDPDTQAKWKSYRQQVRLALAKNTHDERKLSLPGRDPTGVDYYEELR